MGSQTLLAYIKMHEEEFKKKPPIGVTTPINELMGSFHQALELGSGDLRRYGGLLEDTRRDIEGMIKRITLHGYIKQARDCAEQYRRLEQQEENIPTQT